MSETVYQQCLICYVEGSSETAWIPSSFAKNGKKILIGKDKTKAAPAIVVQTYDIKLTQEQIGLNRKSANGLESIYDKVSFT